MLILGACRPSISKSSRLTGKLVSAKQVTPCCQKLPHVPPGLTVGHHLPLPLAHFFSLPDIWLRWRGCSIATLSSPLSLVWLSIYVNHPWLVTEPVAVGVPRWQTGAKASTINPHRPASPSAGTNLAENSLGGVECIAHHPGSRGVATHCVSHNSPVEYKKDLAAAIFHQSGAWGWPTAI